MKSLQGISQKRRHAADCGTEKMMDKRRVTKLRKKARVKCKREKHRSLEL